MPIMPRRSWGPLADLEVIPTAC